MSQQTELKLGYLLPTREKVMNNDHSARDLLSRAQQAEALGFDSLWVGDSLLARPRHDPIAVLAGIAGVTEQVQIGTAVLLPALRNPVVLAQQLATVDQLSAGRLVIGAGIAADTPAIRDEFAAAGVPFEGRVGRLLEGFRLARALWRGEAVDWDGRWTLRNARLAPRTVQPDGPPIWLGASVPAGIRRAAKHFEGWFPIGPDAAEFERRASYYHEQVGSEGKSVREQTVALYMTLAITRDEATGDQTINRYLEDYYGVPAQAMRQIQACYGGPLDGVVDFVRSYVTAGANHLVLRLVGDHDHALPLLANLRDRL